MSTPRLPITAALLVAATASATDFKSQVAPVFKQFCYKCHSEVEKKEKGKLVLDNLTRLAEKVGPTAIIKPGNPDGSTFYTSFNLPKDDDDHMPPSKEAQPMPAQIALIKAWIAEGATFDGSKAAAAPAAPASGTPPMPAAAGGGAAMQTWTNTEGKSIQAKFLRLEGDSVVIQRADGEAFIVPLSKLSPESQAQAKAGQ